MCRGAEVCVCVNRMLKSGSVEVCERVCVCVREHVRVALFVSVWKCVCLCVHK